MASRKKGGRAGSKTSRSASSAGAIAQQIWLAGLGAMARAQTEGPKLFESLVVEGAVIQERGRKAAEGAVKSAVATVRGAVGPRAEAMREAAGDTLERIEKMFQTRVQQALQEIGVPTAVEIEQLSRKVDQLRRSVQDLTGSRPRAAAASRRTTSKRAGRKARTQSASAANQVAAV
ncbi:MAG TPA: phasin family protein [Steroidobacter sp.]|jgi:poly(hydroxyalkanoate) granule-associated protein|nr:phasin family protein [Steroidobacteraceae bacterium]HLS81329.1 phasin family protein [Steroidobacter sp.]